MYAVLIVPGVQVVLESGTEPGVFVALRKTSFNVKLFEVQWKLQSYKFTWEKDWLTKNIKTSTNTIRMFFGIWNGRVIFFMVKILDINKP